MLAASATFLLNPNSKILKMVRMGHTSNEVNASFRDLFEAGKKRFVQKKVKIIEFMFVVFGLIRAGD